jgi:polyhydroxyalkanoate synthesis repressor PhaR
MSTARTIKRYANRKLYDTRDSRYVTLDHIAAMVRAGDDVRVVDNTTRADLTTATLAQIIFEEEKKTPRLSLAGLREIIQGALPMMPAAPTAPTA